ncbi:MAG: hypothetical protein ACR2O2_18635 [Ruegeria sp.]
MNSFRLLPVLVIFVACTTQDVGPVSRSAQFPEFPKDLFDAFKAACADPSEEFSQINRKSRECRQFLPPEATAYLILNFDGYPQKLPQSVMRLTATENQSGFRVDADMYLTVPQKDGSTLKVPVESKALDKKLSQLYRVSGGTPG